MALSKKDRKYILKNYPALSIKDLARNLGTNPREIRDVLVSSGRELSSQSGAPPRSLMGCTHARVLGMAVLVSVISVVYLNSIRNGFHYDDIHSLLQNYGVRVEWNKDPETRKLFPRYFVEPELFSSRPNVGMPRPILMCTFGLNYMLGTTMCDNFGCWCDERGYDPRGWIMVNILLHMANTIIIYITLCHFSGRSRFALLASLIFAVHPVNTETVNYINCRSESLSAFWMLLTTYFFMKSLRDGSLQPRILSFVFFGLGLLTKELAFVLPALLFWIDLLFIYPANREEIPVSKRALQWYLPLFVLMGMYLYYRKEFMGHAVIDNPVRDISDNLLTQARVLVTYVRLLFLPVHQNISYENVIYTRDLVSHDFMASLKITGSIMFLGSLAGMGAAFYKRHPVVSLAIANFFITLSITSSFIPLNAIMNEHRLYLASLGVGLLIAGLLENLAGSRNLQEGKINAPWPVSMQALALAAVLCFASLAAVRNFTWHTDLTIWRDSIRNSPEKAQVVSDLGNAYYRGGKDLDRGGKIAGDGSIDRRDSLIISQMFNQNVPEGTISPEVRKTLDNLFMKGLNRAEHLYQWSIRVDNYYYKAWHNLGTINYTYARIDMSKKDIPAAKHHLQVAMYYFDSAARIYPNGESYNDGASARMLLADLEIDNEKKKKLWMDALDAYKKSIRFNPELVKGYLNISNVLDRLDRTEEALPHLDDAIKINRVDPEPHYQKARMLLKLKKYGGSLEELNSCLHFSPDHSRCSDLKKEVENIINRSGTQPPGSP